MKTKALRAKVIDGVDAAGLEAAVNAFLSPPVTQAGQISSAREREYVETIQVADYAVLILYAGGSDS